jgi:uncharacterized RDD family membrane protein YckC
MTQPPQGGSAWEKQPESREEPATQLYERPQFDKQPSDQPGGQAPGGQPSYGQPQYGQQQPYQQAYAPPAGAGYGQPGFGVQQYQPVPPGYYPVFNSQGQQVLVPLATPGKRFATLLLEIVLYFVTLVIGYFIWLLIAWGDGQTPGKKLTHLKYVNTQTGQVADWGKSAFRDFVIRGILFYFITLFTLTIGWFVACFMTFDKDKNYQSGWDRIAGTVVVDVSNVQL